LSEDRLKIAVFIDFDNIEIGVKTTLGQYFDIGIVLEALKERGEIVTKIAYGDWTRAGDYGRQMSQHAVQMVQRNLTPGGDKNGADINLALDALEMAFTHNHINTFVIVGGDSDFISLVEKLKQYDRKVFVVGGRAFSSQVMQKNCTEFISYENLLGRGRSAQRGGRGGTEVSQAVPLVRRALKLLADREVVPQLGLLKSTLLQLDSAFSERDFGASSFRDFVQKLAHAGFVTLKGSERSFHVEWRDGDEAPPANGGGEKRHAHPPAAAAAPASAPADASGETTSDSATQESAAPISEAVRGSQAAGYAVFLQAFQRPGVVSRWPLYVRQLKQVIKQVEDPFDERKYGFMGIIDALKYCQREGLFRLDRDRMGVVRVYPGALLQVPREDQASPSGPEGAASRADGEPVPSDGQRVPGQDATDEGAGTQPSAGGEPEGAEGRDVAGSAGKHARGRRTRRGGGSRGRRKSGDTTGKPVDAPLVVATAPEEASVAVLASEKAAAPTKPARTARARKSTKAPSTRTRKPKAS
jgi:uncharacterized LabA/DUF88 family protein